MKVSSIVQLCGRLVVFYHANFQANCDLQRAGVLVIEGDVLPHEHNIYAAREPDDVACEWVCF